MRTLAARNKTHIVIHRSPFVSRGLRNSMNMLLEVVFSRIGLGLTDGATHLPWKLPIDTFRERAELGIFSTCCFERFAQNAPIKIAVSRTSHRLRAAHSFDFDHDSTQRTFSSNSIFFLKLYCYGCRSSSVQDGAAAALSAPPARTALYFTSDSNSRFSITAYIPSHSSFPTHISYSHRRLIPHLQHHACSTRNAQPSAQTASKRQKSPPTHLPGHDQPARDEGRLPQSWHYETQEAQFRTEENCKSTVIYWEDCECVYTRGRAQCAAA